MGEWRMDTHLFFGIFSTLKMPPRNDTYMSYVKKILYYNIYIIYIYMFSIFTVRHRFTIQYISKIPYHHLNDDSIGIKSLS